MAAVDSYREQLLGIWRSVLAQPMDLEELTPVRMELQKRINDGFDGGRTAAWARKQSTWRSVRDRHTGHTVHCISDRESSELTADLIMGLRLLAWMRSTGAPVTWFWWDQPWMRVLPAQTIPGRNHVNGGWAVPGIPEVHVYRREEAHKVLLHETIHALLLDVPHARMDTVRVAFEAQLGGRRLWPHLGEAYTELFAEWLWSIAGSQTGSLTDVRRRWELQRQCARQQAAIVWSRIRGMSTAEDTNIFAYYVLKYVLMLHETDVLLSSATSVGLWITWWIDALPLLNRIAALAQRSGSDNRTIEMGMTCNYV
jgi:hypothetical protein